MRVAAALLLAGIAMVPGTASGLDVAGVRLPDSVSSGGSTLVLNGAGVRKATVLRVQVYAAALYVTERTTNTLEILRDDRPKIFMAVMKRDVSRDQVAPAFREGVERSAGPDVPALRSEIDGFERWIPGMREGQNLTVAYAPGSGLTVSSSAKADVFKASHRFAVALFGMWIGPRATDADLRSALLKGAP
jgi:long-chain acyl-CoA synthetase